MGNRPIITIKSYNPDWYPPCFESKEQHMNYLWTVVKVGLPLDENNYCLDCTKEYKEEMMCEGRCHHPETIFVEWRNTYKTPEGIEGQFISQQNESDVVGISNISKYWDSPLYNQHPDKLKEAK